MMKRIHVSVFTVLAPSRSIAFSDRLNQKGAKLHRPGPQRLLFVRSGCLVGVGSRNICVRQTGGDRCRIAAVWGGVTLCAAAGPMSPEGMRKEELYHLALVATFPGHQQRWKEW